MAKKLSIPKKIAWLFIYYNIIKQLIHSKYFVFILLGAVDLFIYFLISECHLLTLIMPYYVLMATNHEYGHYIMAKRLKLSNEPISLAIMKRRYFVTYRIDRDSRVEEGIVLVRFNAVYFDFLSLFLGVILYVLTPFKAINGAFIVLTILNFGNYFLLIEGSDRKVIYDYVKKNGIGIFIRLIISNHISKWRR